MEHVVEPNKTERVAVWDMLFIASIVVAGLGGFVLMTELTLMQEDAETVAEAAGRDLCVLVDGNGVAVNRAYVDSGEPCPVSDGWHTAERIANGDLVVPRDMYWVALLTVMLLFGIAGLVVSYKFMEPGR